MRSFRVYGFPFGVPLRARSRRAGSYSRRGLCLAAIVVALSVAAPAFAQTPISVGSSTDFYNAIQTINNNPNTSYTLNVTGNITMSQQVLAIESNSTITVVGNGHTIDGAGAYRPFFIESGTVALQNLTINGGTAQGGTGGDGGAGGGGGLGAGGAVFVDSAGHLSLQNVDFTSNAANGGTGGSFTNYFDAVGGGAGMGGNGGASHYGQGGGGGLYGAGGSSGGTFYGASQSTGGGGGGQLGNGGAGFDQDLYFTRNAGGGGGGGKTLNGDDGTATAGGAGGGAQGGNGGGGSANSGTADGTTGLASGGGGGAGISGATGADGGTFGGGGGSGTQTAITLATGGKGGFGGFGGGGGGGYDVGGNGGFGGGGGAGYNNAGTGGFGGGGGAAFSGLAASGGFGGGSSGSDPTQNARTGGGGGAGFGGAVFVADGATITVVNGVGFAGNTVTAGAGGLGSSIGTDGGNGAADGNDLFLMRGVTTTFDVTANNTLDFSPVIGNEDGTTGAGVAIDKIGAGRLILFGDSPLVGSTAVDGGTLLANGILGGTMAVNNGGTLMGIGTVGPTTVNAGGTINPGYLGTALTMNGNFTQGNGSTFVTEINPATNGGVDINGSAQIGSNTTMRVVVDPGTYVVGAVYSVLTASGGVSGQYTFLTAPGSGLGFSILYDPLGIELLITSVGTNFAADAQTSNQLAVANVLDATSGTATGDYAYVIGQLETLSSGQMPGALDQLAGDIYPSISAIELQTTTTWMQLLSNRLAQQLRPVAIDGGVEGVSMTGDRYLPEIRLVSFQGSNGQVQQGSQLILRRVSYVPSWTGWTQGYGLGGGVNGNGNAGGLNYGLGGTLFGIDRWLDDNTAVGVTGGYAGTTLRDRLDSDHASINAGQVGVYQLYRNGRFYFSNIDAYSGGNYRVTRPIDFASVTRVANGASSGNQYAHYSEAGLTFGNGRLRLQPFTGLQYIYLDQHGYNETGADSVDLMTSGQYVNSVRGNFGGRVYSERIWRGIRVIPSASARYQREWGNGTQLISSSFAGAPTSSFVTAGNFLGRNFGLFTLSSTALLSERTSIFAALDSQVSQNYYAVIGSGGFQYRW